MVLLPLFIQVSFPAVFRLMERTEVVNPFGNGEKRWAVCSRIQEANFSPLKCREKLLSVVKITASLMKKLFCGLIQLSGGFIWND